MKRILLIVLVGAALVPGGCNRSRDAAIEVRAVAAADPAPTPAQPAPAEPPAASVVEIAVPFVFPDDSGGKLLERMLPPGRAFQSAREGARGPLLRIAPAVVEQPEISLAMPPLKLPEMPATTQKPLRPRPLPDAYPLQAYHDDPQLPDRPMLPESTLLQQRAANVNEPPLLPILAKPVAERASLEDPTTEFSNEQAISRALPMRANPAPFQRMNLPEPFEKKRGTRPAEPEPPFVAPVPITPK